MGLVVMIVWKFEGMYVVFYMLMYNLMGRRCYLMLDKMNAGMQHIITIIRTMALIYKGKGVLPDQYMGSKISDIFITVENHTDAS